MDFLTSINIAMWMILITLIGIVIPFLGISWIVRLLGGSARKTTRTIIKR